MEAGDKASPSQGISGSFQVALLLGSRVWLLGCKALPPGTDVGLQGSEVVQVCAGVVAGIGAGESLGVEVGGDGVLSAVFGGRHRLSSPWDRLRQSSS